MLTQSTDAVIPLHIKEQNAGLIIRKTDGTTHFECFELSPVDCEVLKTKGRLRRHFPDAAVAVSQETLSKDDFATAITAMIAKLSHQAVPEMQPRVQKAGQSHIETRDTTDPVMVTELFSAMLRPHCDSHATQLPGTWKNTRDEVLYSHGKYLPWRRSPIWLLLRVALQRILVRDTHNARDDGLYKRFMVFFMSQVMEHALSLESDTDLIYVMNAKLARRIRKLGIDDEEPWMPVVQNLMRQASTLLDKRWKTVVDADCRALDLPFVMPESIGQDFRIDLPELDAFIRKIPTRSQISSTAIQVPESQILAFPSDSLPLFTGIGSYFNLAAFEHWVSANLDGWLNAHGSDPTSCSLLRQTLEVYHRTATEAYKNLPEGNSLMLITTIDLWIACDKSAIEIHPLLADYDPAISPDVCQALLLRFRSGMERLAVVEQYLRWRQSRAKYKSVLSSFGEATCFSVRYFDSSESHQRLKVQIEQKASEERQAKREELQKLQAEYANLKSAYNAEPHGHRSYVDEYGDTRSKHDDKGCQKCAWENQAKNMGINLHEWPLPTCQLKAKSTVFELDVPTAFGSWRESTLFMRRNVLKYRNMYAVNDIYCVLGAYNGLPALSHDFPQRVVLASSTKPHLVTHRKRKAIASVRSEGDVCLNNGMTWAYYDKDERKHLGISDRLSDEVSEMCTFNAGWVLQDFLRRSWENPDGQPPNAVVARQADCPDHFAVDGFKALCSLPLGHRVVWENILTQLAMPAIDWRKLETVLFVWQMTHQAGPPSGSTLRASHEVLDNRLVHQLLNCLFRCLARLKESWESAGAIGAFVIIATRLLSLGSQETSSICLRFLEECRQTCSKWVAALRRGILTAIGEKSRSDFCQRALQAALIGIKTFDVDGVHLSQLLKAPAKAAMYLSLSMAVRDTMHCRTETAGVEKTVLSALLLSQRRLMFRTRKTLIGEIVHRNECCLDSAVRSIWPAYKPNGQWTAENDCWLITESYSQDRKSSLAVHFNVVTAELLVNGLPLARMPVKYEAQEAYRILIGRNPVEVMPSAEPGMIFSANKALHGYQVHFALAAEDLLVRAWKDKSPWDLVPSRLLKMKLPTRFTEDYVHWYDIKNEVVEFRPKASPWRSLEPMWRLSKVGSNWHFERGQVSLLNPRQPTAKRLSIVFSPLESLGGLHFYYDRRTECLEIAIPRLQIEFEISSGSQLIKSRQYRDMCVDKQQAGGVLVGLRHKLFLHKIDDKETRMVLIPESTPSWHLAVISPSIKHVTVTIASDARRVQAYHMDGHLGRFVGNGSLQSKLFLAQLHALTSDCLPDPFTHYTGTEEALTILRSAGVRSFDRLTEENIQILVRLAGLSPARTYYPENLQVMQVVRWDSELSFLSQTGLFRREVEQLLSQARQTAFLFPGCVKLPDLRHTVTHLTHRDDIRSSTFRLAGFGAELATKLHDREYTRPGRNEAKMLPRIRLVTRTAACFETPEHYLPKAMADGGPGYLYHNLSSTSASFGFLNAADANMPALRYDSHWLGEPKDILRSLWLCIHLTLRRGSKSSHRFRLMTWLATLAFAEGCDERILSILTGLVHIEPRESIAIPKSPNLLLNGGTRPRRDKLQSIFEKERKKFSLGNRTKENRKPGETGKQAYHRQENAFSSKQRELLQQVVSEICAQWPTRDGPSVNSSSLEPYFHLSKALESVNHQFMIWRRNLAFFEYLEKTCEALAGMELITTPSASLHHQQIKAPYRTRKGPRSVHLRDLFKVVSPLTTADPGNGIPAPTLFKAISAPAGSRIAELLRQLEEAANSTQEKHYVRELRESMVYLSGHTKQNQLNANADEVRDILEAYYLSSKTHHESTLSSLMVALDGHGNTSSLTSASLRLIAETSQWPRVCSKQILSQLNRQHRGSLTKEWKETIVRFALSLTQLQASQRLKKLHGQEVDLHKELRSLEHREWSPLEYPDALLLEIEGNLRIRKVQSDIAKVMESPPDGKNAVMQLNMGEGKSSVIVPFVAASLADSSRLVRVIVAKPQSRQMFEMLVSKLGGLIGRRVYHMPFSRALKLTESQASFLGTLYEECRLEGGILLLQPENILSFQLMVIETFIKGQNTLARNLLSTQRNFEEFSRDIVDESDENFSTKFELVYTMGQQRPIDYAPDRWTIIQQVLHLVARYSYRLENDLADSLELEEIGEGRYPRIRFLDEKASTQILTMVVDHVCENGLVPGFPIAQQSKESRNALRTYVSEPSPPQDLIDSVESGDFWTTAKDSLLLIRGLFSSGLLTFVFGKKRWRVNYGLVHTRQPSTRLAVPYQAKDKPSPRSEFSHPDVVICLTSLSYYYGGLEDEELFLALEKLSRSDQADTEYQAWVSSAPKLPDSFRHLQGVNIRDREQCRNVVFPHLRFSTGAVDYFLSHIVFVKEMKEFPERLSASGWDIGRVKSQPTTGFSGTNDSRDLLPLNVEQLDLDSQKHTNALVLEYLLRPENSVMLLRESASHGTSRAEDLLQLTVKMTPEVRVILDVGAQIIEMTNEEVAKAWLRLVDDHTSVHAAIFCDDADHICVLDRSGRIERLQTSPFADQLDVCLVYLDQAHTRGIDLRLPQHYRATVTLGANVVKDRLVQGKFSIPSRNTPFDNMLKASLISL